MAAGKKQYVYRLMKAQCSCGDKKFKQYLNLPKDHGVLFQGEDYPLMNANDHVANEHILTFGRCTSMANPNGAIGSIIASTVIPIIGGALMRKVAGVKCEPMTIVPWIKVDEDYFIDGAPALTLESELPCYYGGVIKIVLEQVEDEADAENTEETEEEEERDIKEQLPSEVQEKLDSFCDDEQTVVQSAGEDALAAENPNLLPSIVPYDTNKPMMAVDIDLPEVIPYEKESIGEVSLNPDFYMNYYKAPLIGD